MSRQGVVHLLGVELPPAAELLEDAVQAVGQRVEHIERSAAGVRAAPRPSVSSGGTRRDDEADDRRRDRAWSASWCWLRWLVAAFGAVQVGFAIRDRAHRARVRPAARGRARGRARRSATSRSRARSAGPRRPTSSGRSGLVGVRPRRRRDPRARLARARAAPPTPCGSSGTCSRSRAPPVGPAAAGCVGAALFLRRAARSPEAARIAGVARRRSCFRAGMAFVIGGGGRARSSSSLRRTAEEAARERAGGHRRGGAGGHARRRKPPRPSARSRRSTRRCWPMRSPSGWRRRSARPPMRVADELDCEALGLLDPGARPRRRGRLHGRRRVRRPRVPAAARCSPRCRARSRPRRRKARPSSRRGTSSCRCACAARWSARCTSARRAHGPTPRASTRCARSPTSSGSRSRRRGFAPNKQAIVDRLTELDAMKTDFVAITSHELRTPLAGIRGFVDMLRRRGRRPLPAEREEFLASS